jgi:hypothetical protein
MVEKHPNLSSYNYCSNNPVNRIDPTGMLDDGWEIDLENRVITKISIEGGNSTQHVNLKGTNITTELDGSTEDFISTWENAGYTVNSTLSLSIPSQSLPTPSLSLPVSSFKINFSNVLSTKSGFNLDKAVDYLNANAYPAYDKQTCGNCARAVRLAIEAGGVNTSNRPSSGSAKDFGAYIKGWGFSTISNTNYTPLKGDVRVIQNYPGGSQHGHMDMYNGDRWVSDFLQNGFWPGSGYRQYQPDYQIYRWE